MTYHGVGVILVNNNGEVLMQHRDKKPTIFCPNCWCYPSGFAKDNEDFEIAAKRELREETEYVADLLYPLIEEDFVRTDGKTVRRHIFWAIYDNKQKIKCNEGQEMKFLKLEELDGKELIPGHKRLCKLAIDFAQKITPLKI